VMRRIERTTEQPEPQHEATGQGDPCAFGPPDREGGIASARAGAAGARARRFDGHEQERD
jgi:hypothetical protein